MKLLIPGLAVVLASCFVFTGYRKAGFRYQGAEGPVTIPVLVPSGYTRAQTTTDDAGNTIMTFSYPGRKFFYIAFLRDTAAEVQPIDESLHQPGKLEQGGRAYKGIDEDANYYREIRHGRFRVGYRHVSRRLSHIFDSASNYSGRAVLR